jgi:conjugative relaxase-like TrwC/TraI family protein
VIEPETGEVKMREVSNRRIAVDFTFSVPKSVSMHLALTHDVAVEKLVHEALREILDDMEKAIQTRVRTAGADHDRTAGNAIVACFVHRTTRPVSARVDPHWHCHSLLMNATYDDVEGRWKAAQLGNLIADKSKYEAMFHSRVAEKLLAARHALRKNQAGLRDVDFHRGGYSRFLQTDCANQQTGRNAPVRISETNRRDCTGRR